MCFQQVTSGLNISCRGRVFGPTKGTGGFQQHKVLIFDEKQHPKNIWFRGWLNHPSVLKELDKNPT